MNKLEGLKPERVFHFFEEISAIPRGSGNMKRIAEYCIEFANKRKLKAIRDDANNVIIYKPATSGYETAEPIILQGHLDIVCQKEIDSNFDFEHDGIELVIDGDYITANGTTLGADNGIAVAMILAILDGDAVSHPAIEAVFTTDEEVGMLGAAKLDMNLLSARRMINLDAEEENVLTVSCAGGSDFSAVLPIEFSDMYGTKVVLYLDGLLGGHSGVEIDKGRVNAATLAGRVMHQLRVSCPFSIIDITGGDKSNAIPPFAKITFVTSFPNELCSALKVLLDKIKNEISAREPKFSYRFEHGETDKFKVLSESALSKLINLLICSPNGIQEMSASISGLVETSLNLGILMTNKDSIYFKYALRSNIQSALEFLGEKMVRFFEQAGCRAEVGGIYPPWEFKTDSSLQKKYKSLYEEIFGSSVQVAAIHAGLECGLFSAKLPELDCIAIGPNLYDVHTPKERMSISSVAKIYSLLLSLLTALK